MKKDIKENQLCVVLIVFLYIIIVFLCFFILESYKTLDWSPYIWGVAFGGVAMVVLVHLILPFLSSILARYNGNEELLYVLYGLLWLPMILIGIVTLVGLNFFLDNSPPMIHEVKVLKKWNAPSWLDYLSASDTLTPVRKRPYVRVISWRPREISIDLEVRKSVHEAIEENSTLAVTTRQGFLGWEWIVSVGPIKTGTKES
jgi:hypothetical protein